MLILDLYCGAGGASWGYNQAGFQVVGVDIADQPNYPFPFYKGDCIDVLNILLAGGQIPFSIGGVTVWYNLSSFDAIHASPPCQSSSALTKGTNFGRVYPDFIPETRRLLDETELPYVIENVAGADIRQDIRLCGEMFGLAVLRHRYFECNWQIWQLEHRKHRGRVRGWRHGEYFDGPYVAVYGDGGGKGNVQEWQQAMRIPWMTTKKELAESIPPDYTEHIGQQLRVIIECQKNLEDAS